MSIRFARTVSLRATEEIILQNLIDVENALGLNIEKWPPLIITTENFILDGHHRYILALKNKITLVPVRVFDYHDTRIKVFDYNTLKALDKSVLLAKYESGLKLPAKSTKHFILE